MDKGKSLPAPMTSFVFSDFGEYLVGMMAAATTSVRHWCDYDGGGSFGH